MMTDLTFDTFKVVPVPVKCERDEVMIEGKEVNNNHFQGLENVKKFYCGGLSRKAMLLKDPVLTKESKFIHKHQDRRLHSVFIRKCHKRLDMHVCNHCRENPPRASDNFWKDLPKRKRGGLFYGVEKDMDFPDHNQTYLQKLESKSQIYPDQEMGVEVKRCKEKGCLYAFKSDADVERHLKIIHDKHGKDTFPFPVKCPFKDGVEFCNKVFETKYKAQDS